MVDTPTPRPIPRDRYAMQSPCYPANGHPRPRPDVHMISRMLDTLMIDAPMINAPPKHPPYSASAHPPPHPDIRPHPPSPPNSHTCTRTRNRTGVHGATARAQTRGSSQAAGRPGCLSNCTRITARISPPSRGHVWWATPWLASRLPPLPHPRHPPWPLRLAC